MKNSFLKAATHYPWRNKAINLVRDTSIEVVIGAVLLASVFGAVSYNENAETEGQIPIAFSEIGKTIRSFEAQGKPVPPLTRFYALTNDALMNIFEANNIALQSNRSHSRFASELEVKQDPAFKIHKQLGQYAAEIPKAAEAALESLTEISNAGNYIPAVSETLSRVWDYNRTEVTHNETVPEEKCDARGENCSNVSRTVEVYDYTIHDYTYHPAHGNNADILMAGFLKKHPALEISENLVLSTRTDAENEYAIEESMKKNLGRKIPTQNQSLTYANIWATGSNLETYRPVLTASHQTLSKMASAWHQMKHTAKSDSYHRYARTDDGPMEYQVVQEALLHSKTIDSSVRSITDGIRYASYAIPALDTKIRTYIDVVSNGKPGDADRLRTEIMNIATSTYKNNFEKGFDVEPFKWSEVALYTLLGGTLGAAAGYGVDRYGDRIRQKRPFSNDR